MEAVKLELAQPTSLSFTPDNPLFNDNVSIRTRSEMVLVPVGNVHVKETVPHRSSLLAKCQVYFYAEDSNSCSQGLELGALTKCLQLPASRVSY